VLEDHIDAALIGDTADFFADFLRFMIDEMVGAELLPFLQLFVRVGSGKHPSAEEFRDLNGAVPTPLPAPRTRTSSPGCSSARAMSICHAVLENEGDRGDLFEGEIFGIGQAIYFGRANKFCAASVDHIAQVGELAAVIIVAGDASRAFVAGDAGRENDFLADADVVTSRRFGRFRRPRRCLGCAEVELERPDAGAHPKVEMIEGAGFHADKDFVRTDFWVRDVENFILPARRAR